MAAAFPTAVAMVMLQVRALLEQVSEKLMAFSEVGISPAHADHIFRELINHEEKACVRTLTYLHTHIHTHTHTNDVSKHTWSRCCDIISP